MTKSNNMSRLNFQYCDLALRKEVRYKLFSTLAVFTCLKINVQFHQIPIEIKYMNYLMSRKIKGVVYTRDY